MAGSQKRRTHHTDGTPAKAGRGLFRKPGTPYAAECGTIPFYSMDPHPAAYHAPLPHFGKGRKKQMERSQKKRTHHLQRIGRSGEKGLKKFANAKAPFPIRQKNR
ncbi:hypothetical protein EFA69_06175 [Rufibacter immobilis]|uniref:Uncharacterized protein n=1 Tax=Rufibacter immobilis TaxID=1348778 RepID=A0A3M9N1W6_9BACT|nr:hypothetical protein EFA69_06175 [Rufibacter immobilis]